MTSRVFEAGGLLRGSSAAGLERFLRRQAGVGDAEANPVSQTVTVRYDQAVLTPDDVRGADRALRLHVRRRGRAVPPLPG